jgi:hypothetical protein
MATSMMTDVPVATVWVWAFCLLLELTIRSAAGAGLLSALAVFIRPNLAPLAVVLAMHYVFTMRRRDLRRQALGQLIVFSLAFVPGIVVTAIINAHLYGSPFTSGYGRLSDLFAWSRVPTNLRLYLLWFAEAHTPIAWCGLVAVLVPLPRLWPGVRDRSVLVVIATFVVAVWAIYCAWLVFDVWWFSRFLLSSWPFIMVGVGSVAVLAYRCAGRLGRPVVIASVIALAVFQLHFAIDREAFGSRDGRRRFVAVARLVRRVTDRHSVIVSGDHSGSIRYYGGRMTMNFSRINDHSLDEVVGWLKQRGIRTYLAVEDWEVPEIRERFSGDECIRALDGSAVAIHEVPGLMRLFDLTEPRPRGQTPIVERNVVVSPTAPPVAPPRLVLRDVP